jgi:hypothetical protein
MHVTVAQHMPPIASVAAGLFLLVAPRIMSCLLGLNGIYHFVN